MRSPEDPGKVDLTELWKAHELLMGAGLEPADALNTLTSTWILSMLNDLDKFEVDWDTGEYKQKDRTVLFNIPQIE